MVHSENTRAKAQARWQLKTIRELLAAYDTTRAKPGDLLAVLEKIHEHPLRIFKRGDWTAPGSRFQATGYGIELCWGASGVRLTGDLNGEEPSTVHLEYQDWSAPWQELPTSAVKTEALIDYARFFHFGS
jgi:hypothetical protein